MDADQIERILRINPTMIAQKGDTFIDLVCCQYAPRKNTDEALLFRISGHSETKFNIEIHWYESEKEVHEDLEARVCMDTYNKYYSHESREKIQTRRSVQKQMSMHNTVFEYELKTLCFTIGVKIAEIWGKWEVIRALQSQTLHNEFRTTEIQCDELSISTLDDFDLLETQVEFLSILDTDKSEPKSIREATENPIQTLLRFKTCLDMVFKYISTHKKSSQTITVQDSICFNVITDEKIIYYISLVTHNKGIDDTSNPDWVLDEAMYRIRRILQFIYRYNTTETHRKPEGMLEASACFVGELLSLSDPELRTADYKHNILLVLNNMLLHLDNRRKLT
jgi:hypothetical protein